MPAMLDDPTSPPITRKPTMFPPTFPPIHITLKDSTQATILAFPSTPTSSSPITLIPSSLSTYLCNTLNDEILSGDTYPMTDPLPPSTFAPYWFGLFGAIALSGHWDSVEQLSHVAAENSWSKDADWEQVCLGSFYIKPNYPGRSSHVCNAGFLVTKKARGKGVGMHMARAYLAWAPLLGYKYSVFNLVYETNTASCRIWDSLGFERIGRVRKCGDLKSFPGKLVDAIQYGYDFEKDVEGWKPGGTP